MSFHFQILIVLLSLTVSNFVLNVSGQLCLQETNVERQRNGKRPFNYNTQLESVARSHNQAMIQQNCYSHQCSGEPSLGDRVTRTGYSWGGLGENIYKGPRSCAEAVKGWMESSGHRKNILGDSVDMGCAQGNQYWTCVYGRRM